MTHQEIAVRAYQGADTRDLLNHIAWTDVIKPELLKAKEFYTKELVTGVLEATSKSGSREQIAGRIYGIDFVIKVLENVLRNGKLAEDLLAQENLHLQ